MLLPLYSYWRYRKVYAEDQDEYVSRIRNNGEAAANPHKFIIESVTNGMPLETIVRIFPYTFFAFLGTCFELMGGPVNAFFVFT